MAIVPPVPPPSSSSASVAFRLKRPYDTEDDLLVGDGHGIRKGGMMLFGAAPRPVGVIVRFEIALRDGTAVFRGEGKVVAHHPSPEPGHPGALQVKLTRLDPRGKMLVDRAIARQEGREPAAVRSPLSLPPPSRDSGPSSLAPQSIVPSPPESFPLDIGVTVVEPESLHDVPSSAAATVREGSAFSIPPPPRVPSELPPVLPPALPEEPPPEAGETELNETRVAETIVTVAPVPSPLPTPVVPASSLGAFDQGTPDLTGDHTLPLQLLHPRSTLASGELDIPVHVELSPDVDEATNALPTKRPPPEPAPSDEADGDAPLGLDLDEPTIAIDRQKLAPREDAPLPAFEPEPSAPPPSVVAPVTSSADAPSESLEAAAAGPDEPYLPGPEDQTLRLQPKDIAALRSEGKSTATGAGTTPDRDALLERLRSRDRSQARPLPETRDDAALSRLRTRGGVAPH